MNLAWSLYLIDVLDKLSNVFAISFGCSLIGILFGIGMFFEYTEDRDESGIARMKKIIKTSGIVLLITAPLVVLTPSKQTLYAMLTADAGEKIVQSQEFKEIGGKALEALNRKLDELGGEK